MKIYVPEYFNNFKCSADKCKDSCCIGWEIWIDDKTRAKYDMLNTSLGKEIREKTSHGYFHLCENGHCSFLDGNGLCRIISTLGDGYLCDICREHPRYYGVGQKGIEGGLGLGCEKSARIILSLEKLPRIVEINRDISYCDDDEYAKTSEHFRKDLMSGIFSKDLTELVGKYIAYAELADDVCFDVCTSGKEVPIPKVTYEIPDDSKIKKLLDSFLSLLGECESLSKDWQNIINKAKGYDINALLSDLKTFRCLLYYFTHRYVREGVLDMSLSQRTLFSISSSLAILAMKGVLNTDSPDICAATIYSKNIEYSTDNIDMLWDRLTDIL